MPQRIYCIIYSQVCFPRICVHCALQRHATERLPSCQTLLAQPAKIEEKLFQQQPQHCEIVPPRGLGVPSVPESSLLILECYLVIVGPERHDDPLLTLYDDVIKRSALSDSFVTSAMSATSFILAVTPHCFMEDGFKNTDCLRRRRISVDVAKNMLWLD
ncbi:hypothetical protein Q5P01_017745 [Channa striata]|uniref:Uncharacterized protein n=1 Tax=Channa striata TaxID=64152 RepID=A0AA88SE61_CHASR|nr:hypothetical protein Q5P01_017745 [Channa striata]